MADRDLILDVVLAGLDVGIAAGGLPLDPSLDPDPERVVRLAVASFVALFAVAAAAVRGEGTITGRVVTQKGKAIAGASVRAVSHDGEAAGEATTNSKGAFRLDVAPGSYRLEFDAEGYAFTATVEYVEVIGGRETKLTQKIELPTAEQGSIVRGTVFTEDGLSLPGARVVIERISGGAINRSAVAKGARSSAPPAPPTITGETQARTRRRGRHSRKRSASPDQTSFPF